MTFTGKSFLLEELMLPPGHTVKIHSGQGETQGNPESQLALYLDSPTPVWNDRQDSVTVYDPEGRILDRREHYVKGR